jgi:UDP-2-acetamido-3-amino-2,3-dideoxy-glucuronate N-acetyltransferase
MVLTNVINPRSHVSRKYEFKTTLIRQGATVGANATIVCGVTLGRYCFIGAGAVVTRDIPDYALVYGNPGRVQGWMCQCGIRLEFESLDGQEQAVCPECGERYLIQGQVVESLGKEDK